MMLVKAITLHMGITMLLAAMITLSDLSLGGKNVLFRLGGSPLCSLFHYFHFLKAMGRTVGLSPASVTVRCTQCFQLKKKKKNKSTFKSDGLMQRKTTVKAKCAQNEFQLSS